MILGIVGSRKFNDYNLFYKVISTIIFSYLKGQHVDKIISGGAIGTDSLARDYADNNNILCLEYLPKYKTYGRYIAPIIRNEEIVKDSDYIIIFWDGISNGTKSVINFCKKYDKTHFIYMYKTKELKLKGKI